MQNRSLAAAAVATAVFFTASLAAAAESIAQPAALPNTCTPQPGQSFRPEAELHAMVESLGYRAVQVGSDAGCYTVIAVNRAGKSYEIKFKGSNLRMVSRYAVKGSSELAAR